MFVATGIRKSAMLPFVMGGRYPAMVTWMGADVVVAPRLSEATAVNVCTPKSSLTVTLNGLVASLPNDTAPSKNWTLVTVPSVSLAEARMVRFADALNVALSTGLVMVTLGGMFPELTVTLTTAEVGERPRLSVATAARKWFPGPRRVVTLYGSL